MEIFYATCLYNANENFEKTLRICTLVCPLQIADFSSTHLKLDHCIDTDDITYIGSFLTKFYGSWILFRWKSKFLKVPLGS